MDWNPKDVDNGASGTLADGVYAGAVTKCELRKDKNGGDMFHMEIDVHDVDGTKRGKVWDSISPNWFQHKFKHFFQHGGLHDRYLAGSVEYDSLIGINVGLLLCTREQDGYPPKNEVKDYVACPGKVRAAPTAQTEAAPQKGVDDDLPF